MPDGSRNKPSGFQELPDITIRQLEVFGTLCRERSYSNAALELHSTRANIKRVSDDFAKAMGRPLFEDGPQRTLDPTAFAQALSGQMPPLARALHRLDDCVRSLHESGRILRFAAAGELFKGGVFTAFLSRLRISDAFRPCFLRIENKRFQTALLNSECDAYFGISLSATDRLEVLNLGPIPWRIERRGQPAKFSLPSKLPAGKWAIFHEGGSDEGTAMLEAFHTAGAAKGILLDDPETAAAFDDGVVFTADPSRQPEADSPWPCFQFSVVMKKHHPYSDLMPRLQAAAAL